MDINLCFEIDRAGYVCVCVCFFFFVIYFWCDVKGISEMYRSWALLWTMSIFFVHGSSIHNRRYLNSTYRREGVSPRVTQVSAILCRINHRPDVRWRYHWTGRRWWWDVRSRAQSCTLPGGFPLHSHDLFQWHFGVLI